MSTPGATARIARKEWSPELRTMLVEVGNSERVDAV
jgi:hypothetical protein